MLEPDAIDFVYQAIGIDANGNEGEAPAQALISLRGENLNEVLAFF